MIFRYNEATGIASLDPAFSRNQSIMWAVHQLYNTLVEVDSRLNLVPSLARSWEVSADKLEYTFHLRTDVFFHDNEVFPQGKGRRMTAADVAYSLGRITDKQVASTGAWIFTGKLDSLRAFQAVDDSTFRLRLRRPNSAIIGILSMQYCSIVAREAVEKWGKDFRNHPCGTGPFRFAFWEEGLALVLHKHERYFETDAEGKKLPYLDAVKIGFLDNKASEFLMLQQGELHFVNDIDPSFKDEVLTRLGDLKPGWKEKLQLYKHAYLNTEYLGILVDSNNALLAGSPLRLRKVRQAINYGFNRQKMMLYLRNSIGTAAESGFIPAGLPAFDSNAVKGYRFNQARARQLLAEAGFPGGRGLPVIRLQTIANYADLASFIARELEDIGVKIQVEVVQKSLLLQLTAGSKTPFFRGSWIADYPDAENYMAMYYSRNPAPPNYTRYSNPRFDELYERCMRETSDSVKKTLFNRMDQLVIEDAPVVPLWYDMVIHLVRPEVKGWQPNGLNLLELRRVRVGN